MTHHRQPPPIDPVQLAQSLAMTGDITDRTRDELTEMLEELAEPRRQKPMAHLAVLTDARRCANGEHH